MNLFLNKRTLAIAASIAVVGTFFIFQFPQHKNALTIFFIAAGASFITFSEWDRE